MTDRIAVYLGLFLAALIAIDIVVNGGGVLVFLARKFMNLMDWVEFWR